MSANVLPTNNTTLVRTALRGVVAGLAGGVVFGIIMGVQNMLPMVGMLIGQENAAIGFVVHMLISALIGATFGVIASRLPSGWAPQVIAGGVYGIVWWVLGALVLMPLLLGMSAMVFVIGDMQIMSLIGHVLFGMVMGAAFKLLAGRI
ncbi:MAG: hypothetical protein HXY40_15130 [Chloroflexi bacterium]|nr:hypothetical protein [Chloroflexota bacterium]